MSREPRQLDYTNLPAASGWRVWGAAARENGLTVGFVVAVLGVNGVLAGLANPGSVLVGGVLSPCVNWLLGAVGMVMLPWVWSRSGQAVSVAHAGIAIALPYVCNLGVWRIACLMK